MDEMEFECPFYQRMVTDAECYDMFMIASGFFKDEALVKEADKKELYERCLECGRHGC